jgi:hypothetical protein
VPVEKPGNKTGCSNYRGISLLQPSYNIVSNILLSRVSPCVDGIIVAYQYGFRRNRSTNGQICLHSPDTVERKGVK